MEKLKESKKSLADDSQNRLSSVVDLANARSLLGWEEDYATDDEILEIIIFGQEFLGQIIYHKFAL